MPVSNHLVRFLPRKVSHSSREKKKIPAFIGSPYTANISSVTSPSELFPVHSRTITFCLYTEVTRVRTLLTLSSEGSIRLYSFENSETIFDDLQASSKIDRKVFCRCNQITNAFLVHGVAVISFSPFPIGYDGVTRTGNVVKQST